MAVFTIETPTGQKLDIEAADEATAINGAKQWHAQNGMPAASPSVDQATDAYKSFDSGVASGTAALLGSVGDLTNMGAKGIGIASDYISDKLGLPKYQPPQTPGPVTQALSKLPTSESMGKTIQDRYYGGAEPYQPQYTSGDYSKSVGSFVPSTLAALETGGTSVLGNLVRYAMAPGLATEGAKKATEGTAYQPYVEAGAGIAASLINPARAITPLPATAARQAAVDALEREGVTSLTAGQRTGNTSLRYLEDAASSAPGAGHGAATIEREGQHQFTDAALRRAGAAGEATPEILAANQRRLGQSFDDLSARNTLVPDNRFINDLTANVADYRNVPASQQRQIVQGYIDDIVGHVNNGHMPGEAYQEMRSRLGRKSDAYRNNDPALSQALGGMQTSLDNAMRRSMSPADVEAWDTARRQYAAQKTIETAASRAGEVTAEGQITPANLRNTVATQNRGGYARGEGQFNELARSGVQVMTPLPNSGTAQRTNAFHLLNAGLLGIPQALAGRAVMSPPVQSYLANQLLTGALPTNPTARDLLIVKMLQQSQQPTAQAQ